MSFLKSILKSVKFVNRYRSVIKSQKANGDDYKHAHIKTKYRNQNLFIGATIVALLGYHFCQRRKYYVYAKKTSLEETINNVNAGDYRQGLPEYSLSEVSEHSTKEKKVWITYKRGVYDITEYVHKHPGGDQILMAAGNSVEPFWLLYAGHHNAHVYRVLENFRIGNLRKEDAESLTDDMPDPYRNDPQRHSGLIPCSLKPFNAGPLPSLAMQNFITPKNHFPVPEVDVNTYELEIEVEGCPETMTLKLTDIKKLPKHTITAALMCSGNRRSEMSKVKPIEALMWGHAAISNATWTGAKLRDVLKIVGVDETTICYKHVQFEGLDVDGSGKSYGASIPIWKAVDNRGDTILAYEMNGEPLPRDHGFPVRVLVPGVAGARSVKWLSKIIVSRNESDCHWQQNDYKGFSPSTDYDTVDYTKSPSIQELPVNSAICIPSADETVTVEDGHVLVKGYAWSGGGQRIVRVDVTVDSGKTWHVANIDHQDAAQSPQHWSWSLWSIRVPVDKRQKQDTVRYKADQ